VASQTRTSLCLATYVRWQRGTARIHPPLLQQSIDISCLPNPQQQTCSSGFAAVGPCWDRQTKGQTDRRTDTVTFHRLCSAYYVGSVNNQRILLLKCTYDWLKLLTKPCKWLIGNYLVIDKSAHCRGKYSVMSITTTFHPHFPRQLSNCLSRLLIGWQIISLVYCTFGGSVITFGIPPLFVELIHFTAGWRLLLTGQWCASYYNDRYLVA